MSQQMSILEIQQAFHEAMRSIGRAIAQGIMQRVIMNKNAHELGDMMDQSLDGVRFFLMASILKGCCKQEIDLAVLSVHGAMIEECKKIHSVTAWEGGQA